MNVEIRLEPSAGLGRSIHLDLSTYAEGKIDLVREMKLEQTTVPSSVVYPVILSTVNEATFLPLWNNPNSSILSYSELPTVARTGRAISFDIKKSVKRILNNVSPHQFFMYPSCSGDTTLHKIGRLSVPLSGHQAVITVNLCYGFDVSSNGLLNSAGYSIYRIMR